MRKLLLLVAALALAFLEPAAAQTVFNSAAMPTLIGPQATLFTSPGTQTLYTGGSHGSLCFGGTLSWDDQSTAHVVTFNLVLSSVTIPYVSFTTTTGLAAGTIAPPLSLFGPTILQGTSIFPLNQNGNQFFELKSGDTWTAGVTTAITGGDFVGVTVYCADFQ